jgi:hypothetical protein
MVETLTKDKLEDFINKSAGAVQEYNKYGLVTFAADEEKLLRMLMKKRLQMEGIIP